MNEIEIRLRIVELAIELNKITNNSFTFSEALTYITEFIYPSSIGAAKTVAADVLKTVTV